MDINNIIPLSNEPLLKELRKKAPHLSFENEDLEKMFDKKFGEIKGSSILTVEKYLNLRKISIRSGLFLYQLLLEFSDNCQQSSLGSLDKFPLVVILVVFQTCWMF